MENKRKKKKTSIGIIIFLVFILGISYAFFTLTLKGSKDLKMNAGTLSLEYKEENAIMLEKAYPISDQEGMELVPYEFSIKNTGDVKALYDIILEENEENTLNHVWLKYSLKKNEEEWSTPQNISSLKLEEGLKIEPGETDSYQLRLWIDGNVGNEIENKVFRARVIINSVQSNSSTSDLTPPEIKLNGSLSESIEEDGEYIETGVESVVDDRDTLDKDNVEVSYKYFDGETTTNVDGVDTSRVGVYYIYYKIKDSKGNEGRIIRSINIYKNNTKPPEIRLNGKSVLTINKGSTYQELGATASKRGEDLTSRIVVSGEVNVSQAGSYEVKYVVTDDEGNTASIVRIVHVVHINEGFYTNIKLDLSKNPRDKIHLEGENLGEITYTSSDDGIVSVDADGNVEAHDIGEAVITITTSTGVEKEVQIKVVKTVTVTYERLAGVSSIGKTSDACEITTKGGSCNITLPTISPLTGYNTGFWSNSNTATSGIASGSSIQFSENMTYYAKALDTTKPVWSLVSTSPSSGAINPSDTLTITFKGTDTSGSVTSTLAVGNITVKSGSTTVSPSTKSLSSDTNVTNGKQYTLTLSGIHTEGVISITIGSNTLKDGSNNIGDIATFTTGVTIQNTAVDVLLSKTNPTTLTYTSATSEKKKEMFTFTHTAGSQQSGWSASELTDYRYIGTSVNNYVTFNNEVWRIIGIFTVEDDAGKKEKRMKIIRDQSLGNYSFDNKWSGTGSSDSPNGSSYWVDSRLKDVLNSGAYYNRTTGSCPNGMNNATTTCNFSSTGLTVDAKKMIGKAKWYLGGWDSPTITASGFYRYERGTAVGKTGRETSWVGEVGLMYPSDYGYATSESNCLNTTLNQYNSSCINTDWLYNSSIIQWTITPYSNYSHTVLYVLSSGYAGNSSAYNPYAARPSVYLKSSVSITSGDGSSGNPYQLKI